MKSQFVRHCLIILNLTPDSFSDGGKNDDFNKIKQTLKTIQNYPNCMLDIGAESTAPCNKKISKEEEWKRFSEIFFPVLDENTKLFGTRTLSFDTYKIETIVRILRELEKRKYHGNIIWNDISGKLESDVVDILRHNKNLKYILCHNMAPSREESQNHMSYVDEDLAIIHHVRHFFENAAAKNQPILDQLIFDPCFGFSKSYQQNWEIIQHISTIFQTIPTAIPVVIGISKKSFLKKVVNAWESDNLNDESLMIALETLHALVLGDISRQLARELIFRVHEHKVYDACQFVYNLKVGH